MTKIMNYIEEIDDELCGAKEYAEKYIELKAVGNMTWANRLKEMATDELKHANWIHEMAISEIEQLKKVYVPPTEMQEVWDKSHTQYVEKAAWIKQMLSM